MYPYILLLGRKIPSYGVCIVAGVLTASGMAFFRCKKEKLDSNNLIIIITASIGGAILGAKLLYILVSYHPMQIIHYIRVGNYNFLIEGGFVFYGGLIFGILGAIIGAKIAKTKLELFEKSIVPCIPFGHAIGRIGCFLAGCCYGIQYTGIGNVRYLSSITGIDPNITLFPVQIVESIVSICVGILLLQYTKKTVCRYNTVMLYLTLYAIERFLLEFLRGDLERGVYIGISTSQWISLIIIVGCIIGKLYFRRIRILENK